MLKSMKIAEYKVFALLRVFLVATILCFGFLKHANALSYELSNTESGKVSLIFSGYENNVKKGRYILAGVKFDLPNGWDTYWKSPGDAGVPLDITLDNKNNVKGVEILWPAPKRFVESYDLQVFGYENQVVLPIKIFVGEKGASSASMKLFFNLCSQICVPFDVAVDFTVNGETVFAEEDKAIIEKYLNLVPKQNVQEDFKINEVVLDKDTKTINVTAYSKEGFHDPDLIIESLTGVRFPKPSIKYDDSKHNGTFSVNYQLSIGTEEVTESDLEMVLVDGKKSIAANGKQVRPELNMPEEGAAGGEAAESSFVVILLIAVLGGFILNFMPCVLPVLSIKVLSVLKHGGGHEREAKESFLWSALGIISSFLVLAAIITGLKTIGMEVGWGFQFQEPNFIIFIVLLLVLFACNMWDIFEIKLPQSLGGAFGDMMEDNRHSKLGSFLSGAFAALLATPCSAPFVGTASGFAISAGGIEIFAVFAAMGFGLALPFVAFAINPSMVKALPKPGVWMLKLKKILGLLLVATSVWLLWVLSMQIGQTGALFIALICIAMIVFLWACTKVVPHSMGQVMAAAVIVLSVLAFMVPEKFHVSAKSGDSSPSTKVSGLEWEEFDEDKITAYVKQGRTVFVEVTADWCLTCKANRLFVVQSEDVQKTFADNKVILMEGDWTNRNDKIRNYLKKFGRYGIPFNAVYGPASPDGAVLPELLTTSIVKEAVEKSGKK